MWQWTKCQILCSRRTHHPLALVALVVSLVTLVVWLLKEGVPAVIDKLRRAMSRPYS
jgi:hypothetical protein